MWGVDNGEEGTRVSPSVTAYQRLTSMHKSFERDKSVLAADYKYFITPGKPTKQPRKQSDGKSSKCHPT